MYDNLKTKEKDQQAVAVVTGGNRGIGLNITEAFVNAGYFVVIGARTDYGLHKKYGEQVVFESIDVRSEESHRKLVKLGLKHSGRLDVYVNNAGYSSWRSIDRIDGPFLDELLDTNLKGAFWGCKAAAESLKKGGSIINISSIASKRGSSNNSAYVASKFGMNGLTQSLAKELGPKGIRVNALCPVLIRTDGLLEALKGIQAPGKDDPDKFLLKFATDNAALKRLPTGEEVGDMCVVLASKASSAITGQCINIDCGVFPQ
jgi:NAD(P)-dependent dehydrogenase (short-subunit alcohol dehydrogenase family)